MFQSRKSLQHVGTIHVITQQKQQGISTASVGVNASDVVEQEPSLTTGRRGQRTRRPSSRLSPVSADDGDTVVNGSSMNESSVNGSSMIQETTAAIASSKRKRSVNPSTTAVDPAKSPGKRTKKNNASSIETRSSSGMTAQQKSNSNSQQNSGAKQNKGVKNGAASQTKQAARKSTGGQAPRKVDVDKSEKPLILQANNRNTGTTTTAEATKNKLPTLPNAKKVFASRLVDTTEKVDTVYCSGCGARGTLFDCPSCNGTFSLTDCHCGLDPADPVVYAAAWVAGEKRSCFPCSALSSPSDGGPSSIVTATSLYAKEGEISSLIVVLEPRYRTGEWTARAGRFVGEFLRADLPQGSFAVFSFQFDHDEELETAFDYIQQLLVAPQKYLPARTRLSSQCRVLLFTFMHGRFSSPSSFVNRTKNNVNDEDAGYLYPVLQTTYPPHAPSCIDLPRFFEMMQQKLFQSAAQFTYPLSLLSLGACNVVRDNTSKLLATHEQLQNDTTQSLLSALSRNLALNIIVPVGSPTATNLVMEAISIALQMTENGQSTVNEALARSIHAGSTAYIHFNITSYNIVSTMIQVSSNVIGAAVPDDTKSHLTSTTNDGSKTISSTTNDGSKTISQLLDQFEHELPCGKLVEQCTLNKTKVARGWAVPSTVLCNWLYTGLKGALVSSKQVAAALRDRPGWLHGLFRYDHHPCHCWIRVLK